MTPPTITSDEEFFWNGVDDGRLLLARCALCSSLQHPPTPMCPQCGSLEWTTQEASGRGKVHSWIVSRHPTQLDTEPRVIALIELVEGVRLVSNLHGVEIDGVRNDMDVELIFTETDGVKLPQFRPLNGERSTGVAI
ncbi:MAG TPA: OB-fold domain-containing protein [Acidimicrobiales bacterium]|nr:OB-fold domain-containing protein [Acidimicrobiales bacterium]